MVVIIICLFVPDDSLTIYRFTASTEQLTKCCESLQKMRVRLGACKIDLGPPVILFLIVPRRYFCCGSICFMFWCRFFVLFESYVCTFLYLHLKSGTCT